MRVAVVGHVEWVEFARVEAVPKPGEIAHAFETWEEPAGGGAVAAVQLARLAGSCVLLTAFGSDELGRRSRTELTRLGVDVRAIPEAETTRRAFTFVDDQGERTITALGDKLRPRGGDSRLPWHELRGLDAVYFVSGDAEALHHARLARVLVATARELATLREAGVQLDALVGSGEDEGELYRPGDLEPPPKVVVTTSGSLSEYPLPPPSATSQPRGITTGPDGALWFSEAGNKIGRITTSGSFSEYSVVNLYGTRVTRLMVGTSSAFEPVV